MHDPSRAGDDERTERWITEPILTAELPADVRTALGELVGSESVPTLQQWASEIHRLNDGAGLDIDDLCHAEAETPHWGEVAGERYYFLCFYDAVLLSGLVDGPVDVRTESPNGTVVRARATGTSDLTVTPGDAVVSFGVETGPDAPARGDLSQADLYSAVCPYVRAFPSGDAYEEWAGTVSAATIAMPLRGATDLAAALIE